MAARFKIIILERLTPGTTAVRYVLWADVPASQQPFRVTTATSAWPGAQPGDNTALQNGSVVERVGSLAMDGAATAPQVRQALIDLWTAYQAEITASKTYQVYGTTWDGTTWTPAGG